MLFDGWVLNFGDGFTRGANAIFPLYPSSVDVEEKIAACEMLYARKSRETVFRITNKSPPEDLDARLEASGYTQAAQTSVQVAEIGVTDSSTDVSVAEMNDAWLEDLWRLSATPPAMQPGAADMLEAILPPRACASLRDDGKTVAIGLGVLERGYVGLWDIIVDVEHRNQGLGERILAALLNWGKRQGATRAYLAVLCENAAALRLYEKHGFREVYQYWYRYKRVSTQ